MFGFRRLVLMLVSSTIHPPMRLRSGGLRLEPVLGLDPRVAMTQGRRSGSVRGAPRAANHQAVL